MKRIYLLIHRYRLFRSASSITRGSEVLTFTPSLARRSFRRLAQITIMASILTGCAAPQIISYTGRSFVPAVASQQDNQRDFDSVEVRTTNDMNNDSGRLYDKGYELVGFSQFISPLAPLLADTNAKATASAQHASLVLTVPPQPASYRQHYYLMTYWRPADPTRYMLGAWYGDLPPSVLGGVGCANNVVMVQDIIPDSPAARAGLKKGDTLWAVNDKHIFNAAALDHALYANSGKQIELVVARDDGAVTIPIVLNPAKNKLTKSDTKIPPTLGFQVDKMALSKAEQETLKRKEGFYVAGIEAGSAACAADLQTGDLVVALDGKPLESITQLNGLLDSDKAKEVTIRRGQRDYTIELTTAMEPENRRLALPEAGYGLPWHTTKPSDWSAMAGTLAAAQILVNASGQYVAAQSAIAQKENARRANLYRQMQAARAAEPVVWEGRGRVMYTRASNGQIVSISRETASAMSANPGSTVQVARGHAYLADRYGHRINTEPVRMKAVTRSKINPVMLQQDYRQGMIDAAVATADLGIYTTRALDRQGRIMRHEKVYGNIWRPVRGGDVLYDWQPSYVH